MEYIVNFLQVVPPTLHEETVVLLNTFRNMSTYSKCLLLGNPKHHPHNLSIMGSWENPWETSKIGVRGFMFTRPAPLKGRP